MNGRVLSPAHGRLSEFNLQQLHLFDLPDCEPLQDWQTSKNGKQRIM